MQKKELIRLLNEVVKITANRYNTKVITSDYNQLQTKNLTNYTRNMFNFLKHPELHHLKKK